MCLVFHSSILSGGILANVFLVHSSHALARQLQAEEEYLARQEYEAQRRQEYLRQMSKQKKGEKPVKPEKKKSKDCAIM